MNKKSTNILIIGSGVAAGVIAESLLDKGIGPVTILEAGGEVEMRNHRIWLDMIMTRDKSKYPLAGYSDRAEDFISEGIEPWDLVGGRLIVKGGSTMHWGGWCPRMKPEDFELKSRIGFGGLDWPFSYTELEPYYVKAEHYLQVAGDSTYNDPPRSASYLYEAPPFTLTDNYIIRGLDELNISYMHIPIARNARPINGKPACLTTGTCDYCPIEARFTGNQPLDRLKKKYNTNKFILVTHAVATKVLVSSKKKVYGIECVDMTTGETEIYEAEKFFLCCGSLEIPKLLLQSISNYWTRGIGNDFDQVGRNIVANPYLYMRGTAETNPYKLQEELFIPTLGSRHWDTPEYQREGKFFLNRAAQPDNKLGEKLTNGVSMRDMQNATIGQQQLELQGTIQTFSYSENRVLLDRGKTRLGLPKTRIISGKAVLESKIRCNVFSRMEYVLKHLGYKTQGGAIYPQRGDHAMCTTRMSENPADGVVDSSCKVHQMDNLYIMSNAIFPSGSPANPTLTLVAVALRFIDKYF